MSERLLSLAAGTVLDLDPVGAVEAAAAAGWPAVGLWFDADAWTSAVTTRVADALSGAGLVAVDLEPVILGRGPDAGERMIEVAAELGVPNLLVASGPAPRDAVVERVGTLAEMAAERAPGLTLALEFLPIFTVGSLDAALDVIEAVGAPNLGVLVDTLHLDRSGGSPADLLKVDPARFPYLQLADAPFEHPEDLSGLLDEALNGRLLPGHGALPLAEVLTAIPAVPISVELRSASLIEAYPDPVDRARVVLDATQALLRGSA